MTIKIRTHGATCECSECGASKTVGDEVKPTERVSVLLAWYDKHECKVDK